MCPVVNQNSRFSERGVLNYNPDKAFNGMTLYSTMGGIEGQQVFLINVRGEIVHQWNLAIINKIFKDFFLDNSIKILRDAYLYPNGDLVCVVTALGKTPWGGGIITQNRHPLELSHGVRPLSAPVGAGP